MQHAKRQPWTQIDPTFPWVDKKLPECSRTSVMVLLAEMLVCTRQESERQMDQLLRKFLCQRNSSDLPSINMGPNQASIYGSGGNLDHHGRVLDLKNQPHLEESKK